jgi:hypothetical protein
MRRRPARYEETNILPESYKIYIYRILDSY